MMRGAAGRAATRYRAAAVSISSAGEIDRLYQCRSFDPHADEPALRTPICFFAALGTAGPQAARHPLDSSK
jgi:hypothetical protein